MLRTRGYQATAVVLICIGFFLTLDYFAATPRIIDFHPDEPDLWTVRSKVRTPNYQFMLITESRDHWDHVEPFIDEIESLRYGEFVQYEVEFLPMPMDDFDIGESVESGLTMNVPWVIGGYKASEVEEALNHTVEYSLLIVPSLSLNRTTISGNRTVSMYLNATAKNDSYARLMVDSGISDLVIVGEETNLKNAIINQGGSVHSVISLEKVIGSELSQVLQGFPEGTTVSMFVRHLTRETVEMLSEYRRHEVTVICESTEITTDRLDIKVITPKTATSQRYLEFIQRFSIDVELTFEDASIYDACKIAQLAVEESRLRPWDHPESFWEVAKTYDGITGNTTLNRAGDRAQMEFILVTP